MHQKPMKYARKYAQKKFKICKNLRKFVKNMHIFYFKIHIEKKSKILSLIFKIYFYLSIKFE